MAVWIGILYGQKSYDKGYNKGLIVGLNQTIYILGYNQGQRDLVVNLNQNIQFPFIENNQIRMENLQDTCKRLGLK